ncbi:MAG: hypothetical protein LBC60_08550, partial [Spirochaetaceae bacterium]|nr:hypothetical protein [Spirochaetaceae bacterium]
MNKLCLAVAGVLIAILSIGASIWEGAAAVSISGELPESGYYVATKSFPRNTVVDITNLESGKTVRAIVATGLDSPGLLAILSKDAADIIGIQARSIGRIRITVPSDPIAFSRFTEGLVPKGDPDHDPQAAINGASPRQTAPQNSRQSVPQNPPQDIQPSIIPPGTAVVSGNIPPVWDPTRSVPDRIIPPMDSSQSAVLWPWEQSDPSAPPAPDRPTAMNPVLPLPEEMTPPRSTMPRYASPSGDPYGTGRPGELGYGSLPAPYGTGGSGELGYGSSSAPYVAGGPGQPGYGSPSDLVLAGDPAYGSAPAPFMGERPEETPPVSSPPESAYRPSAAAQPDSAITYEQGPELIGERGAGRKSIAMEAAEERPPEPYITLPPEAEIAPIASPRANPPAAPRKEDTVQIPEEYILPEIAAIPRSRPVPESAKPETVRNEPVLSGAEEP